MGMLFHQSFCNSKLQRFLLYFFLAVVWFGGIALGALTAPYAGDAYVLLMRRAADSPVSIVGLFAGALLPFLISAYAVQISKPILLCAVCFAKAFLFAFCACGISAAYGSAGWLVQILIRFSDWCFLPFLCWFSFRHINDRRHSLKKDFSVGCMVCAVAGIFDYCLVSPFLVMLIDI